MTDWVTPIILSCLVAAFVAAPQFKTIGTERAIVYSTSIVGVVALVWLLLAVSGCSRRVPTSEPDTRPTPWCVSVKFSTEAIAMGCFETHVACERAAEQGRRHGRLAGISAVGACKDNRWLDAAEVVGR